MIYLHIYYIIIHTGIYVPMVNNKHDVVVYERVDRREIEERKDDVRFQASIEIKD